MPSFRTTRSHIGSIEVVELLGPGGIAARVATHGAVLLGLEVRRGEGLFNIAAGYRSEAEILARAGSRFALLVPFAGRVRDARYSFDGISHDLAPGASGDARAVRHGFVRDEDFAVSALDADADAARAVLHARIAPHPGYPWSIDLDACFTLREDALELAFTMRNVSMHAAPCYAGWHAYFRVREDGIDGAELQIPARTAIRTDAELLALKGDAAYAPIATEPLVDFRTLQPIGTRVLDHGFTDLAPCADGRLRTLLRDPRDGFAIRVVHDRGVLHAFSGDTLAHDRRGALALEPMECMADAFNRPEWHERLRLTPGASRTFACGVEWARA